MIRMVLNLNSSRFNEIIMRIRKKNCITKNENIHIQLELYSFAFVI